MKPKIWLTRPAAQGAGTRQAFKETGFDVVDCPVLTIEPICDGQASQAIRAQILGFDRYAIAIFVSQNAVQYGCHWLDEFWPQLPQACEFLAVGSATQQALQNAGLPVVGQFVVGAAMNSEELLDLPQLQVLQDRAVIIFRGEGGRTHLGDVLRGRGARVDYCELYRRQVPEDASESIERALSEGPAWLSVHSGESLQNLERLLQQAPLMQNKSWLQWPLLVPGQRVAAMAKNLGFTRIIVADNATDIAMCKALKDDLAQNEKL